MSGSFNSDKSMGYALKGAGCKRIDRQIKVAGNPKRVWVIRNHDKWAKAEPHELAAELLKGQQQRHS